MSLSRSVSSSFVIVAIFAAVALVFLPLSPNPRGQLGSGNAANTRAGLAVSSQVPKVFTLYSGLWRTDHSFVSTIRIQNSLVVAPLEVEPVLFMADGTPFPLRPVQLPVSGVLTLDINEALSRAPDSLAGHMSDFGSAALIYRYPNPGHLQASISMVDAPRSLTFTCPFGGLMEHDSSEQTSEGLWWKHDSGVSGFVALSNLTDTEKSVNLQLLGSRGSAEAPRIVEVGAHSTKMINLDDRMTDLPAHERQLGGVRVQYEGPMGAVAVTGGLENDGEGFSAGIPIYFHDLSSSPATDVRFASAGVMVGKPDPMMMPGFPTETKFSPYLVLRNTSEKPMVPRIELNYMAGNKAVSRVLPTERLRPLESRKVDLQAAIAAAGLKDFSGLVNLSVSLTEHIGDLVLATGSVDQTGTYVFEVEPQGVAESGRKIAQYWSVADGNDTMFSLWNPTDAPQDILVTIFYGDGSGKYLLPVHLDPQGSTMIGMAMLIMEKMPDTTGNVIPSRIVEGSAAFESSEPGKRMNLVIAGGIFNVADATCGGTCINCCAVSLAILPFDPFCPVGEVLNCSVQGTDCNGTVSAIATTGWSSSNTSVATVNSSGVMTTVAPGKFTLTATFRPVDIHTGRICLLYPQCTTISVVSASMTILSLSLSPTPLNMSSGDTNVTIKLTITPSSASISPTFNAGLSSNPNSSSPAAVTVTNPSSPVSGSYNAPIKASGNSSPSGLFNIQAVASGVTSNVAGLTTPPQILIQMMQAEAQGAGVTSMTAVGEVVRNRFSSPLFNTQYTTYQNAIVQGQFAFSSTTTGIEPELDIASSVFAGVSAGNFCGSLAFWTPTSSQWQTVQTTLQSGTTTFPSNTGAPTYTSWPTSQQQILFVPAIGTNSQGVPYFLFLTPRSSTQAAAVNASCN